MRARPGASSRTPRATLLLGVLSSFLSCSGAKFSAKADSDCLQAACAGEGPGGAGRDDGGSDAEAGEPSVDGGAGSGGSGGSETADGGKSPTAGSSPQGGSLGITGGNGGGGVAAVAGGAGVVGVAGLDGMGGTPGELKFPQTSVLDDFDRAGPAIGDAWIGTTEAFSLQDQTLWCKSCNDHALWAKGFGPRQEVFATLVGFDTSATEVNLVLKAQPSTNCDQIEVLYAPDAKTLRVAFCAYGGWVDLERVSLQLTAGDRIGARIDADNNLDVFKNGALLKSYAVKDYPFTKGHIGVSGIAGNRGLSWDDFGGGEWQ